MLVWALGCATPFLGAPEVEGLRQVVPGPGLPAGVEVQAANNNLDIAWHEGRLFLAFRTSRNHFANDAVRLHVISTDGEEDWRHEGTFFLETDLREPQLLSWQGELHLWFAVLGTNPLDFEPQGARRARWLGPGRFTDPEPAFDDTFIPWRIKTFGERVYVTGYTGGENVYEPDGEPISVHWLASDDALTWGPAFGADPVVLRGGGSETDLVIREDGSVVAVVRNEAGDETGFGSKVCTAPASAPMDWTCAHDPRKYDSPLVFERGGRVWLVARRNLTPDGHFDLGRDDLDQEGKYLNYQFAYWNEPKRCSLWEVHPDTRTVSWVLDLASRGDTCFPEAVDLPDGNLLLYNYSSPVDGADVVWQAGQVGPTNIYRQVLNFNPEDR